MDYRAKYLKYKSKYLHLKGGMGSCDVDGFIQNGDLISSVGHIDLVITGSPDRKTKLLIIPGFSEDSYKRNRQALQTLIPNLFKSVHFLKFNPIIKQNHDKYFREKPDLAPTCENNLYRTCAEAIHKLINPREDWTILAKSAGAGVGLYLYSLSHYYQKLIIFAPGIRHLGKDKDHPLTEKHPINLVVGWNEDDEKVPMKEYLPLIKQNLDINDLNIDAFDNIKTYNRVSEELQHEIHPNFIVYINEN